MFSLERLLISFSALIGDSVSKTPKMHVLLCLLTFGLLAIGMLLVEIEDDVFKLWVRILYFNFIVLLLSEIFSLSFRGEFSIIDRSFARVVSAIARAISKERRKRRKTNRGGREKRERCWILCFSLSVSLSLSSLFYFFKIQFFCCSIQFCLFSFPRFFLTDSLFASLLFLKFVKIRAAAG